MTVKQDDAAPSPPIVTATAPVEAEPEISVTAVPEVTATAAPVSGSTFPAAGTTTTTYTTYTIPAPQAQATTTTYTVPPPGAPMPPVNLTNLGRSSVPIQCPYCKQNTRTIPTEEIDCFTISMFIVLLLIFWPVCWLPFVLPECKNTNHTCASCGRKVGATPACNDCCK